MAAAQYYVNSSGVIVDAAETTPSEQALWHGPYGHGQARDIAKLVIAGQIAPDKQAAAREARERIAAQAWSVPAQVASPPQPTDMAVDALKNALKDKLFMSGAITWAAAWLLWLLYQHATWMWGWQLADGTSIDLAQAHHNCSGPLYGLAEQIVGPTALCTQQASAWSSSTLLFWLGVIGLGLASFRLYRANRALKQGTPGATAAS